MLSTVLLATATASCGNDGPRGDVIWDISPFDFTISVSDKNGSDLLDPLADNSISGDSISIIWRGVRYMKDSIPVDQPTRAYFARFYGLQTIQDQEGRNLLYIGEFFGDAEYENEQIVVDWNDGSPCDTLSFSHAFWWKRHKPHTSTDAFWNGEPVGDRGRIDVVK